jgi:GAF domain
MIKVTADHNWTPAVTPAWLGQSNVLDQLLSDRHRLAAVAASGWAGSTPESAFDAMTRLATRLLRVPACFIALNDGEKDQYKSHHGFAEPLASERVLHGRTFCHYTLAAGETLVIDDTRAHSPWRDVPTVRSMQVNAYIGVPIRLDGQPIASFCAIDVQPHAWSPLEIEVMQELARSAERELGLRVMLARARADIAPSRQRAEAREALLLQTGRAMREPLQALKLCSLQLQRNLATDPGGRVASVGRRMTEAVELLQRLTRQLIDDQPGRAIGSQPVPLRLDELLANSQALVAPVAAAAGVTVVNGGMANDQAEAWVEADLPRLLRLLSRLHQALLDGCRPGDGVRVGLVRDGEHWVIEWQLEASATRVLSGTADDALPGVDPAEQIALGWMPTLVTELGGELAMQRSADGHLRHARLRLVDASVVRGARTV